MGNPTRKDNMVRDYPRCSRLYGEIIKQATKCPDNEVGAVEQLMRWEAGTLDHLSRRDFNKLAKRMYAELQSWASEEG